jgi:hypothetical protein
MMPCRACLDFIARALPRLMNLFWQGAIALTLLFNGSIAQNKSMEEMRRRSLAAGISPNKLTLLAIAFPIWMQPPS